MSYRTLDAAEIINTLRTLEQRIAQRFPDAGLAAVRAPKIAKTLPKPLSIGSAKRVADADVRAGEERAPWVLARDAAVLALL